VLKTTDQSGHYVWGERIKQGVRKDMIRHEKDTGRTRSVMIGIMGQKVLSKGIVVICHVPLRLGEL